MDSLSQQSKLYKLEEYSVWTVSEVFSNFVYVYFILRFKIKHQY